MDSTDLDDQILKKFENENLTSDENEKDFYNFQLAFEIVAEGSYFINKDDYATLQDLFLALGYTLSEEDIDSLCENIPGFEEIQTLPCEVLFEGFTIWRSNLLSKKDLASAYAMYVDYPNLLYSDVILNPYLPLLLLIVRFLC
jgi:hypothetical protein